MLSNVLYVVYVFARVDPMISDVRQHIKRNQYHGVILFDTLSTMIATTMLIGALIRLVVALWASAGATLQSTRSLESIVRTAHEFQEGRTARLDIKHKEILFDHSVARLGFHVLRSDQDILVVTFSPTSAKKRYPLTTAYVR